MGALSQDLHYAVRLLRTNFGFTIVAILTLALGIGANTTIFSIVNALVLRPLRLRDPDQLVTIDEASLKHKGRRTPTMGVMFEWKKHSQTLQDIALAAYDGDPVTISGIGHAERVSEAFCGVNYFDMLGVKAFRGRTFLPDDDPKGEGGAAVISADLWQRTFAADPNVLGQILIVGGEKKTIVGVLPPGFSVLPWKTDVDVWLAFNPAAMPAVRWLPKMGRLKPGVTIERARAELTSIAQGMPQHSDADAEWTVHLESLHETFVWKARRYLYILLGAVIFILLIACANVANLLLARATVRQKEMAIRASLGAGRWRMIRQLLAESLLLGLMGGALGVLVGFWGMRVLVATAPIDPIHTLAVSIDWAVLGFTLAVSMLTGIVFGLIPAFRASRPNLHESLKEGGRQGGGGARQLSQGLLLVSEVALGVVLLAGAGLFINSFIHMQKVDLGFNAENVLRADVFLDGPKFWHNVPGSPGAIKTVTPQGDIFYQQLLERIQALPGVISGGISHLAPPGDVQTRSFRILGRPAVAPGQEAQAGYDEVSAGFFGSLKIPLVQGRYVTEKDIEGSPWVVDINQTMARRYFPNEDPIGKMLQTTIVTADVGNIEKDRPRIIVGVVSDVRHYGASSELMPVMYGSYRQHGPNYPGGFYIGHLWKSITIRTGGDPMSLVAPLQKAVAEVDKDQALFGIQTVEDALADWVAFPRFQMYLFTVFGGLGLVLAAVGIYGVTSYLVSQRTHEIGVRVALGARPGDVLRLVLVRGFRTILAGLVIGIAGSLALTRLIGGFLFGVNNTDPVTYSIVASVLMGVALVACYVPARRATKVDPLVALRHE